MRKSTYTYTIYDAHPAQSGPCSWPSHADVEFDAGSDDEAVDEVRAAIGRYETGRSPGMGMWALAQLEWADWGDLTDEEADEVVCSAILDAEDDPADRETPTCAGTA